MAEKLHKYVCNEERFQKALENVRKRLEKMSKRPVPICSEDEALAVPEVHDYFMRQRGQISGLYHQAKKSSRQNYGDVARDVKSLLVPYLFAMKGAKPTSGSQGFKEFAQELSKANNYFMNKILEKFDPRTTRSKKTHRITGFDRQLDSWWSRNKSNILKEYMDDITKNPNEHYGKAITYTIKSNLTSMRKTFGIDVKAERAKEARPADDYRSSTSSSSSVIAQSPDVGYAQPYNRYAGRGGGFANVPNLSNINHNH